MAACLRYVCDGCATAVEAWDDGNPYVLERTGQKRYVYHPDPEREHCTGNDTPHLCGSCGHEFNSDSNGPSERCPACASTTIVETYHLAYTLCPFCKQGHFRPDTGWYAVS